ncbi:MAG: hypothetical protein Q7K26_00675 [bacterium]|nr:hypothetical protein [bacterium]
MDTFKELFWVVILPALAIGVIALVAMVVCYNNPKWRHLVGPDPELATRKKKKF